MLSRPPVEKIRRLALVAAVAVALVLAASYGVRRWRAYQARRAVPAAIAGDVEQQAEKFTFSRSEAGRTLFTVQASRTIERTGNTTVLENVVARIYGRRGERADEIRTGRCEYDANGTGEIYCSGSVSVTLGAAGSAEAAASPGSIQLTTTGVRFDTLRGAAWTDQPVRFSFPEGAGEAVGLRYQPDEPTARLESQVRIRMARGEGAPVEVQGSELHFYARPQALELLPSLSLKMEEKTLVADRVRVELDPNFHARRIQALGRVRASGRQDGRDLAVRAPRAVAFYAPDGGIERLEAGDGVEFIGRGRQSEETLTTREAVFTFDPSHRRVARLLATGAAEFTLRSAGEIRELRAPVLELVPNDFGPPGQLLTASQRGTLVVAQPDGERRTLEADRIQLFFDKEHLRRLAASGRVETKIARPDGTLQTTASDELRSGFDADGNLAEAEQWGRFRYDGGRWRAEAGRALFLAATQTFRLREQPAVSDATTRTTARTIEIAETTGTLQAEGEVRTSRRPSPGVSSGFGTGEPMQLAAERLRVERERGRARYEGQARMWEGKNRLAAEAIELFETPRQLVAEGAVSGLFLEAAGAEGKPATSPRTVTVTAERFTYRAAERRGVFEGDVKARNDFGLLSAPRLDVFLAADKGRGAQSLERAHAEGGVRIEQPDGHASSERADYRADTRTIVLSGGSPTIVDARRSTITGAQLTLFLADGTILVNSDEGTRTVTRRPWTR